MAQKNIKCRYCNASHAKLNGICTRCEEKLALIRIIRRMGEEAKAERAERIARESEKRKRDSKMTYLNRSALIRKLDSDFRKCCEDCRERGCAENCLDCIIEYGIMSFYGDRVDIVKCRDCPKRGSCDAFMDEDDFCLTEAESLTDRQPANDTLMSRFMRCE